MSRDLLLPDASRTIHVIGDTHHDAGQLASGVLIYSRRNQAIVDDINSGLLPVPVSRIQVGDGINFVTIPFTTANDDLQKAWWASITDGAPWHIIVGNHDLFSSGSIDQRTRADWAAVYGDHGPERLVVDHGFVVMLGLNGLHSNCLVDQDDLDWLDSALTAHAGRDCWIFHHHPLTNTVVGPILGPDAVFSSTEASVHAIGPNATDDTQIRSVIAAHDNAVAWVSGHSHSPYNAPGLLTTLTLGGKTVAHINAAAPYYAGRVADWYTDPVVTLYLTAIDEDDEGPKRIEVRFRNHVARTWEALAAGSRVNTVSLA